LRVVLQSAINHPSGKILAIRVMGTAKQLACIEERLVDRLADEFLARLSTRPVPQQPIAQFAGSRPFPPALDHRRVRPISRQFVPA
jgi:hypothetical protein